MPAICSDEAPEHMTHQEKLMDTATAISSFGFSEFVARVNTDGIDNDTSLFQPQPGGNCPNWVMGHLTFTRGSMLEMLGATPPWPADKYARYHRGSDPLTGPGEAIDFKEIVADFLASQQPLNEALQSASSEQLKQPFPNNPVSDPDATVGSMVIANAFHEAYHLGQMGILRRLIGLDGAIG